MRIYFTCVIWVEFIVFVKSIDIARTWNDFEWFIGYFLTQKKEPKLAMLLSFIEFGIELFWVIYVLLVKEKDYGDVVLFFMGKFKILSWRMDGTDRL